MAVRIRLARRGRKKRAMYDVVVADARAPRDGRFIEKIGVYNPNTNPATIDINTDKAFDWVMKGAQPSDTVTAMLKYRGVLLRKHLQIGVNKGAISQEEADKRLTEWLDTKQGKIQGKADQIVSAREAAAKSRLEAETKVNEARAEAQRKKLEDAQASAAEIDDASDVVAEGTEETSVE